jgi:acyl-CoA dehydrogenase
MAVSPTGGFDPASVRADVDRIAREVVAPAADSVDRENRFPQEAVDALRAAGLLCVPVPVDCGGPGLTVVEQCALMRTLAGADASLGIVLLMHWTQLEMLARFGDTPQLRAFLREVQERQLLVASVNSEIAVRGTERASFCFVDGLGDGTFRLVKESPVISFGEYADAFCVTARRAADAAAGDQVMAVVRRDDTELTATGDWDAFGLRGSRSLSFHLEATGSDAMVVPRPYDKIVNEGGLPVTNVLWAHMWLGMAEAAAAKAHRFTRAKGAGTPEKPTVAPLRLAELATRLDALRGLVHLATARFEEVDGTEDAQGLAFIQQLQTLKVAGSDLLVEIVTRAFGILGLAGFRNGSEWSLGRQLRDAHGASLMVSNDAILGQNAQIMLVRRAL